MTTDQRIGPIIGLLVSVSLTAAVTWRMFHRDAFTLDADGIHLSPGGRIPWADVEDLVVIPDPDADSDEEPSSLLGIRLHHYEAYLASLDPGSDTVHAAAGLAERRRSRGAEFDWRERDLNYRIDTIRQVASTIGGRVGWARAQRSPGEREAQALADHRLGLSLAGRDLACTALFEADLVGADLRGADLRGVDLAGGCLRGADLTGATLTRGVVAHQPVPTLLGRTDLTDARLVEADLRGADLSGADLTRADLRGAHLESADLTGADLSGADLANTWGPGWRRVREVPRGLRFTADTSWRTTEIRAVAVAAARQVAPGVFAVPRGRGLIAWLKT